MTTIDVSALEVQAAVYGDPQIEVSTAEVQVLLGGSPLLNVSCLEVQVLLSVRQQASARSLTFTTVYA